MSEKVLQCIRECNSDWAWIAAYLRAARRRMAVSQSRQWGRPIRIRWADSQQQQACLLLISGCCTGAPAAHASLAAIPTLTASASNQSEPYLQDDNTIGLIYNFNYLVLIGYQIKKLASHWLLKVYNASSYHIRQTEVQSKPRCTRNRGFFDSIHV